MHSMNHKKSTSVRTILFSFIFTSSSRKTDLEDKAKYYCRTQGYPLRFTKCMERNIKASLVFNHSSPKSFINQIPAV